MADREHTVSGMKARAAGASSAPTRLRRLSALCACTAAIGALSMPALADTFKCVDANGRATYTNITEETKGKNCTLVMREISVVPATPPRPAANARAPAGFPKVDPSAQKAREDTRRKILEDELADEEKALEQARAELKQQESVRSGGERNYQRVLDRLQKYQDDVDRHEKNVAALKKELGSLR